MCTGGPCQLVGLTVSDSIADHFFWSPHLSVLKDIFSWVCQILQRGIFQSPALGQVEEYISEAMSIPEATGKGTEYLLLVMQYVIYSLHYSCHLPMEPLWIKVSGVG